MPTAVVTLRNSPAPLREGWFLPCHGRIARRRQRRSPLLPQLELSLQPVCCFLFAGARSHQRRNVEALQLILACPAGRDALRPCPPRGAGAALPRRRSL